MGKNNMNKEKPNGSNKLGCLISFHREKLGLTMCQLAEKVGVNRSYISQLESGKTSPLKNNKTIKRLAEILDLDVVKLQSLCRPKRKLKYETTSRLGCLIRSRREELEWNIPYLAGKVKVSKQYISLIELGKALLLKNNGTIKRIAEVLGLDIAELQNACRFKKRLKRKTAYKTSFSEFFTTQRLKFDLTQRQWAEHLGINLYTVSQIENGHKPSRRTLDKISKVVPLPMGNGNF